MPTLYTLSYSPSSSITESLTFNTENNKVKYTFKSERVFFIRQSVERSLGKKLAFENSEQEAKFKQALKNRDIKSALEIAQQIEKLYDDPVPHQMHHPVRYFLEGYVLQQQKDSDFNKSFCVKHGIFKRHTVQFEAKELDANSIASDQTEGLAQNQI